MRKESVDNSPLKNGKQVLLNGEVHIWYQTVLGYSDGLVGQLLDEFDVGKGEWVLDPFCGTGTTLVECMKRGINAIGIDANPSSCFASRVKTRWDVNPHRILDLLTETRRNRHKYLRRQAVYTKDPTFQYLQSSGMIDRGWISPEPLRKAIALKHCIADLKTTQRYRDLLMLALIAEVVNSTSNVRFGPELYCGAAKDDANVFSGFQERVLGMAADVALVRMEEHGSAVVVHGDARECGMLLGKQGARTVNAVICSPPYPAEHDYTRNARLELAFLEMVLDLEMLRAIKRRMVRSTTKNIYKGDNDEAEVSDVGLINSIADELQTKVKAKTYGFAGLYPKVVREYFGGMKRHLAGLASNLSKGVRCAYVVGDQSSYLQVPIPTAKILSEIAGQVGFRTMAIRRWRTRWSTATAKMIDENILLLEKS